MNPYLTVKDVLRELALRALDKLEAAGDRLTAKYGKKAKR